MADKLVQLTDDGNLIPFATRVFTLISGVPESFFAREGTIVFVARAAVNTKGLYVVDRTGTVTPIIQTNGISMLFANGKLTVESSTGSVSTLVIIY